MSNKQKQAACKDAECECEAKDNCSHECCAMYMEYKANQAKKTELRNLRGARRSLVPNTPGWTALTQRLHSLGHIDLDGPPTGKGPPTGQNLDNLFQGASDEDSK